MIYTTKTHFIGRFMLWINWELVTWIWLLSHYPPGISAVFMQIDGLLNIYEIKNFQELFAVTTITWSILRLLGLFS